MIQPRPQSSPRILSTGLVALDVLRIVRDPGRTSFRAGGTAGNVASILGALGWRSTVAGPTDESTAYRLMLEDLRRCRVRYLGTHHASVPVIVEELHECATHRFAFECPICGKALPRYRRVEDSEGCNREHWNQDVDVFFADRLSDRILDSAIRAHRRGACIVYEPSDPADAPWVTKMLALAHMVKYSADRAGELPWSIEGDFLEIRTQGARGLDWRWGAGGTRDWRSMAAVTASRVVDTCGAGDWLTSGILIGLIERVPLHRAVSGSLARVERILRTAQQLAAWSCGYAGARGALYESGPSVARAVVRRQNLGRRSDPLPEPKPSFSCVACPI